MTISQLILFFSPIIYYRKLKMLNFLVNKSQSPRGGTEFWAPIFTLKFGTSETSQVSAPLASRTLTQRNSLVLTSVSGRSGSQCYQIRTLTESNPQPPVLYRIALTYCDTAHPYYKQVKKVKCSR
jgi:hypothetical protein